MYNGVQYIIKIIVLTNFKIKKAALKANAFSIFFFRGQCDSNKEN